MSKKEKWLALSQQVDELTRRYPPGTPCRYWPGAREGEGYPGKIRSAYLVTQDGLIAVFVESYPGYIAATHVEPIPVEGL